MIAVRRRLPVDADEAWEVLVDLDAWPLWGPSVRRATLDGGGRRLVPAGRGRVVTAVGVSLPFEVSDLDEHDRSDRCWSWRVAGVPATRHRVERLGAGRCLVTMEVPTWSAPYGLLCRVAIGKISAVAGQRSRPDG